jgi:copper(I)-binding protein
MFDIKKKLVKGFNFPMVLKFKESGRITVIVEVKEIGTVKNLQMNHKKIHKH